MSRILYALVLVLALASPSLATDATSENVSATLARVTGSARNVAAVAQQSGPESAETHDALELMATTMDVARHDLSQMRWASRDAGYRDLVVRSYARLAASARATARGEITLASFAAALEREDSYFNGALDQMEAAAKNDDGNFISDWPSPLNKWWFWTLVVFGPVVPLAIWLVVVAGSAATWLARMMRRGHS